MDSETSKVGFRFLLTEAKGLWYAFFSPFLVVGIHQPDAFPFSLMPCVI